MKATLCIKMEGSTCYITNPENGQVRDFGFDFCYWSHDNFTPRDPSDKNSYSQPNPGSNYADQDLVFKDLGISVLNNAFDGFHTCLFAYGQTGSGKSYSMTGYGENTGILPRTTNEIFNRIEQRNADKEQMWEHRVEVSMTEIYNERVHDLLVPPKDRPKEGLNVREHPKTGVFIEHARFVPVSSWTEIDATVEMGTNNRTIGATQMNATSSRAHTVVQIKFSQKEFDPKDKKVKRVYTSNINLIDLAGSERSTSTGATGDRLAEGNAIN